MGVFNPVDPITIFIRGYSIQSVVTETGLPWDPDINLTDLQDILQKWYLQSKIMNKIWKNKQKLCGQFHGNRITIQKNFGSNF